MSKALAHRLRHSTYPFTTYTHIHTTQRLWIEGLAGQSDGSPPPRRFILYDIENLSPLKTDCLGRTRQKGEMHDDESGRWRTSVLFRKRCDGNSQEFRKCRLIIRSCSGKKCTRCACGEAPGVCLVPGSHTYILKVLHTYTHPYMQPLKQVKSRCKRFPISNWQCGAGNLISGLIWVRRCKNQSVGRWWGPCHKLIAIMKSRTWNLRWKEWIWKIREQNSNSVWWKRKTYADEDEVADLFPF